MFVKMGFPSHQYTGIAKLHVGFTKVAATNGTWHDTIVTPLEK